MRRFGRLAVSTAAVLVVAATPSWFGLEAADAKGPSRVRFAVDFRGTVTGDWRSVEPVDTRRCTGHDASGTFTSSVRTGRRFTVLLEKPFGRLEASWYGVGGFNVPDMGIVTSTRTAQRWRMISGRDGCQPRDEAWVRENCGSRTFEGQVRFDAVGSTGPPDLRHRRAYLAWQLEPVGSEVGCMDGIQYAPPGVELGADAAATLDLKKLYSCGVKKPRRCTLTIGGSSAYPHHATYTTVYGATVTQDSTRRLEWSATFRAVGTR